VFVGGHLHHDEALGGEVGLPRFECIERQAKSVDDDRLALEPARRDAVRPEERMGEQSLVGGGEMAVEHLARVQLHRQHVDERPGATELLEERQVLMQDGLERLISGRQ